MNKEQRRALFPEAVQMLHELRQFDKDAHVSFMKAGEYEYGVSVGEGVPATVEHYAK